MRGLAQLIRAFIRSDGGPTATEYAVLLALIAVSVIGAMSMYGQHMNALYTSLTSSVDVF